MMTAEPTSSAPARQIIPAATVIVFRRDPAGGPPQLMMLERSAQMRFAGGATVFPGGRIDPADRELASRVAAALPPEDGAARIAGIRETLEEAGLLVGVKQSVTAAQVAAARQLLFDQGALAPVLDHFGWTLDPDQLVPFARWCPQRPKAFDTRFYLADLGTGLVAVSEDGTESARLFWSSAADTLAQVAAGQLSAIFPTLCNLERLAQFASFAEARDHAGATAPQLIEPWVETIEGVEFLTIPADAGYPVRQRRVDTVDRG